MPKFTTSAARNKTVIGWNCDQKVENYGTPPSVILAGTIFYGDGSAEQVRFALTPGDPAANLRPRNFQRTQITLAGPGNVRHSETSDKAIKQAFETFIGAASTQTATSEDETP